MSMLLQQCVSLVMALGANGQFGLTEGTAMDLDGCQVYHNNQCNGEGIDTDPSFADNKWFTPSKGDAGYHASFQDYSRLVGYAQIAYTADHKAATVEIRAEHKDPSVTLTYVFAGASQSSPQKSFTAPAQQEPVSIQVQGSDGSQLDLEPVDFVWTSPPLASRPGDYRGGQKGAIVELFGWPHADVEKECPHLAEMGYLGVKLFPAMEQVMSTQPFNGVMNPWYFMYQSVSYRLGGRMGSRDALRSLIHTCRKHGVRVYADAVINHMVGSGNDANTAHRNPDAGCSKWGNKTSSLQGGHSPYYTQGFTYTVNPHTGKPPLQEFPAVPYGPLDFHCERALNSWTSPLDLNAGWLTGLVDLNTERENVRERIAAYLVDLWSLGMSGFRIDAAKHVRPDDLAAIFSKVRRNLGGHLPVDFISWLEVLLGGEADLLICNSGSGYNFGSYLTGALAAAGFTAEEALQIKTWNSGYPKETERGLDDCQYSPQHAQRQVIQNDDHDQQNPGSSSRDMQSQGCVLIKGCEDDVHRGFEEKLFTNPEGARDNNNDFPIRSVLSSFYWGEGDVVGIPDGLSDCSLCTTDCQSCKGMPYAQAYNPTSTGYDKGAGQYTRVHRDVQVVNAMRRWMGLPEISSQQYAGARLATANHVVRPTGMVLVTKGAVEPAANKSSRVEVSKPRAGVTIQATASPLVNVMLPLTTVSSDGKLSDAGDLASKLDRLKDAGVDGVMVDVWWGATERQPRVYHFDAYHQLVQLVEQRGMKVQFVASFHRCGGNVGDECDIPLPSFVRENLDVWYTDKAGNQNQEYISLFADNVSLQDGRTPLDMYGDWMAALAASFSSKLGSTISEIQVGMGPCGELRYPSYVMANGWEFCGVGEFQVYDKYARTSLSAAGGPKGWTSPPSDAGSYNSRPGDAGVSFFQSGYTSDYGRFFLDWYFSALKSHGAQVLQRARAAFQNKVPLAGKVAGIHWWYGSDSHAAELTAGYYNTDGRDAYAEIAEVFRSHGDAALDFTCLEMRDAEQPAECQARPEELVGQVANAAKTKGVYFNGENALQRYDWTAYDKLLQHKSDLHAFTYLRLDQKLVTDGLSDFNAFVQKMHDTTQTLFV